MNKYTIKLKDQDELINAFADESDSETEGELVLYKVFATVESGPVGFGVQPVTVSKERLLCGVFSNVEYFYIGQDHDKQ